MLYYIMNNICIIIHIYLLFIRECSKNKHIFSTITNVTHNKTHKKQNCCVSNTKRSVLGPKRLIYFFMNNIFNLKGSCVLRTLKNSFAIFLSVTDIHTHTHTQG